MKYTNKSLLAGLAIISFGIYCEKNKGEIKQIKRLQ